MIVKTYEIYIKISGRPLLHYEEELGSGGREYLIIKRNFGFAFSFKSLSGKIELSEKTIGVGNPSYKDEQACPFTTSCAGNNLLHNKL
jgi:hypothetical protein